MRNIRHGKSCDSSCCLRIQNLSVQIVADAILKDVHLHIHCGQMVALIGPNGAGKTTTIKMLSCLIKPTCGDAFIEENSIIKDELKVKGIIGVSPQETAVAPNLSVKENLEFICEIHGINVFNLLTGAS